MNDGPTQSDQGSFTSRMTPASGFNVDKALRECNLLAHSIHPGVTALRRLLEGYDRWVNGEPITYVREVGRHVSPLEQQTPIATVITCSDSRLDFKAVLNQPLGQVFWSKTAANIAAYVSRSSVEYSIEHLNVPLLLILAHSHCGGVTAAINASEHGLEGASVDSQRMMRRIARNIGEVSPDAMQNPGAGMRTAVMANAMAEMNRLVYPGESARDVSLDEHTQKLQMVLQIMQDSIDSGADLVTASERIRNFVNDTIERRAKMLEGESIIVKAVKSGQLLLGVGMLDMETNGLDVLFPYELPGIPYPDGTTRGQSRL